jgi:hypothetical protein
MHQDRLESFGKKTYTSLFVSHIYHSINYHSYCQWNVQNKLWMPTLFCYKMGVYLDCEETHDHDWFQYGRESFNFSITHNDIWIKILYVLLISWKSYICGWSVISKGYISKHVIWWVKNWCISFVENHLQAECVQLNMINHGYMSCARQNNNNASFHSIRTDALTNKKTLLIHY